MAHVVQYTQSGEAHGLVDVFTNSVPFDDFKSMKPATAEKCRKEREEDNKKVKVRYINKKGNHERLDKHYCRWAGDQIEKWHLIPNQIYEVPYGLVKEVNGMKQAQRSGLVSIDGNPMKRDESPIERDQIEDGEHMLVPVEFF